MSVSILHEAISFLGGQTAAVPILERSQATISGYLKDGSPPAEVCMRIDVATHGRFPAEKLRPDLAAVFAAFRKSRPIRRKAA